MLCRHESSYAPEIIFRDFAIVMGLGANDWDVMVLHLLDKIHNQDDIQTLHKLTASVVNNMLATVIPPNLVGHFCPNRSNDRLKGSC
jgi:hypothetical protein